MNYVLPPGLALLALLPGPLLIILSAAWVRSIPILTRIAAILSWLQLAAAAMACGPALARETYGVRQHGFAIDRAAAVLLLLTTVVAAAALTHAVGFFDRELSSEHAPPRRHVAQFYIFVPLFLLSMYAVISAQNLGLLWIAMEATTLLSAPLVYYHRSRTALEATWKYLIICSVGIAFAFFGTAIIYSASQRVASLHDGSLLLPMLQVHAAALPHGPLRLGFVFILLGYGTKAGLFPIHSWLPDAHSEAPAPASALLSGALLNCALLALWRVRGLMVAAGEGRLVEQTLLPMALLTVVAPGLFLLRQRDLKRMLAYSSMENVGVIAVAIAVGSSSGFLLQAVNHSLVKVALFLLAGNLLQLYGSKKLRSIRGLLDRSPAHAICFLAGIIAVAGTPPFGSFLSEWQVLSTAADHGGYFTVVTLSIGLAIAFIALLVHAARILLDPAPAVPDSKGQGYSRDARPGPASLAVPAALLCLSLWLGMELSPAILSLVKGGLL